jgi:hypothetical protein
VLPVKAILTLLLVVSLSFAMASVEKPFFAKSAVYLYGGNASRSPDDKKTVEVVQLNDETFASTVKITAFGRQLRKRIDFGLNAQVLWSTDSNAFAITGSDTGGNAQYRTDVFVFEGSQVRQIPITLVIQRAFGHPITCEVPEPPNVVAVKWLKGSNRLLVAAQIVNHSICDSAGTFRAYEVDIQNKGIIRSYGQIEAKKLFGSSLGDWLASANDECITNPKSCEVPYHHQAGKSKQ